MKAALAATVLLLLALPAPTAAAASGKWTVLVYLDADNDLEPSGMFNMHEMEATGPAPGVRILVQMDRAPGYDESDGDWQDAHRYEITKADAPGDGLASPVAQDLGEVDMSDPATLRDFLEWGVRTAPADHYLVILWDHGAAWDGIAADETSGPDSIMALDGVHTALSEAAHASGIARWDVLDMDACLMATVEAAHALRDDADLLVASEELVPGQGLPYPALLRALDSDPAISPGALAHGVVGAYASRYAGGSEEVPADADAVLSTMDLHAEAPFWTAVTALSDAIAHDAGAQWPAIVRAAQAAEHFKKPDEKNSESIDVVDLATRLAAADVGVALKQAAQGVLDARAAFVKDATTAPNHPAAKGIAMRLALPGVGARPEPGASSGSSPAASAAQAIAEAAATDEAGPAIDGFALDSPADFTPTKPLTFHATVADPHLADVEAAVSHEGADGETILLYLQPLSGQPEATSTTASFSWDGRGTTLTNGELHFLVPAYSAGPAGGWLLDGNYSTAGGAPFAANLEFDGNGTLVHAWDVADDASELTPRAGDVFTPLLTRFDANGDPQDVAGQSLPARTSGSAAWRLDLSPVEAGSYLVSIYAEDLAGNANLSEGQRVTFSAAASEPPATPSSPQEPSAPTSGERSATPAASTPDDAPKSTPDVGLLALLGIALVVAATRRR